MSDDPVTDRHAHLRLDAHERAIEKHDLTLVEVVKQFAALDKNSEVRHATSQEQNAAILARLNQPSVVMSILGNPTAITGIVSLLGAVIAGAVALGYTGAPVRDVPVLAPVPAIESRSEVAPEPLPVAAPVSPAP